MSDLPGARPERQVLMLAYFFPPIVASGSMRPAAFCAHLHEHGYRAHVVSTNPDSAGGRLEEDVSLLDLLPPDLRVERLAYVDRREVLLRLRRVFKKQRNQAARDAPAIARAMPGTVSPRRSNRLMSGMRRWANRLLMFPDEQKDWGPAVERYVRHLPERDRPDVVFATGSPWTSLLTGVKVARFLDVPLVADFRDPWAVNLKAALGDGFRELAAARERQVLEAATRVLANTDALRDYFVAVCPQRADHIVTLTNGINKALLDLPGSARADPERRARIEVSYFGSVTRARIPAALLWALDELHRAGSLDAQAIRISFTGPWAPLESTLADAMARLEAAGIVERKAAVPYSECLERMRRADHLLILQQGFPMQIPAKIYEYMAMRRPMIILGGEGATAELVTRKQLGIVCPDELDEVRNLLSRLIRGELQVPAPTAETVAEFGYPNLTRHLARVFDDAIEEYRRP